MILRRHLALVLAGALLVATGASSSDARPLERRVVQKRVDRWLRSSSLRGVSIGVSVRDAADGRVLAAHDATERYNPASGAKLLTTAAALLSLPLHGRWTTRVHRRHDALILVGGGDPKLLPEHMDELSARVAAVLESQGGEPITRIVVDAHLFDGDTLPPAYDQKDTDAGYRPAIGAAGCNFGAVAVVVRPGRRPGDPVRVRIVPPSGAVVVKSDAITTAGAGSSITVRGEPLADGRTRVAVHGTLGSRSPGDTVRKRVANPDLLTGYVLRRGLVNLGLPVGEATVRVATEQVPDPGPEIASLKSRDLRATIADINTWSNNFMAEMLLKHLGGLERESPATWQAATDRVSRLLAGLGLAADQFQVVNGSGLYRATSVSAEAMTKLLVAMAADPARGPPFRDSLAVGGRTGTLRSRLRHRRVRGRVQAKTGTLDEVVSLSGYLETRRGHTLAFSVLINDATPERTGSLRRATDRLLMRLARL